MDMPIISYQLKKKSTSKIDGLHSKTVNMLMLSSLRVYTVLR